MIWAFVLHLYFGIFRTLWGLFLCVCAFCTRLAHVHLDPLPCTPPPPSHRASVSLSLSSLTLVICVCSCWLPHTSFVPPPLSLCPLFQDGGTALMKASRNGHAKVVELLLAAGAR
jgi:hypothetical protein